MTLQVLLFLVAAPGYILLLTSRVQSDITLPDIIFTAVILCLLTIEFVADGQQWGKSHHFS
jgi:steroid 5-alpha reductase family enzyme